MSSEFHPPVHRTQGANNAIISLILGLGGLVLSVLLIGIFFAIPGLILAIIHVRRYPHDRVLALWGIYVSAVAVVVTVLFGILYVQLYFVSLNNVFDDVWESSLSEWVGVSAPNIEMTTQDGDVIDLQTLAGRRVIVHVWDAECPTCDESVNALNEIHRTRPEDEIMVIGLCDGDPAQLDAYASETGAAFVLATAGVMPAPFDEVSMPPVTFVIDRNGVIQHVLEDNDPKMVTQAALETDYAGEPKATPDAVPSTLAQPASRRNLNQTWTASASTGASISAGDWDHDGADEILILDNGARLRIVSAEGTETATMSFDASEAPDVVELGRGVHGDNRILLYEIYGYIIDVFDAAGKPLWQFRGDDEVNEAHWTDLDGDGIDELLVATDMGLHAVSPDGAALWKVSRMGAIWSQKALDATTESDARIIVIDENNSVALLDGAGRQLEFNVSDTRAYTDLAMMRLPDRLQLLIGGENVTVAIDGAGAEIWRTASDEEDFWRDTNYVHGRIDGDATPEWAFVEASGDLVVVSPAGEALARLPNQHRVTHFAVAERDGGAGLLVTLRNGVVRAYTLLAE